MRMQIIQKKNKEKKNLLFFKLSELITKNNLMELHLKDQLIIIKDNP